MYEPIQYLAAILATALAITALMIVPLLVAWAIHYFGFRLEFRSKGMCPRCKRAKVRLSTVGIFWRLYWFYPILFSPFALVIAVGLRAAYLGQLPDGIDVLIDLEIGLAIAYFALSYMLLLLGMYWNVVPSLLGSEDYECPACKEKYYYYKKKIVHRDDLPRVRAVETAVFFEAVDSQHEAEEFAEAATSRDESGILREIAEKKLKKGATSAKQEETLRTLTVGQSTEEK